jgi:hypothetical protein
MSILPGVPFYKQYNVHMKRKLKSKQVIIPITLLLAVLAIIFLIFALFCFKHWYNPIYFRKKVEHTVSAQVKPLKDVLTSLGFTNLSKLDTKCGDVTYEPTYEGDQRQSGGAYFECSSGIDRYTKVPTDAVGIARFNQNAAKLSQILQANGWKSRPDYPTVPWFQKISQGVDYQPDQLNKKKINDLECTVDFFTAYSKMHNQSPAISVRIFCNNTPYPESPTSLSSFESCPGVPSCLL